MDLLRISAVSYLNTFPFVYGINESGMLSNFNLLLDVPSKTAERLKAGDADVALIPVGALPEIGQFHYISDFCVGAVGAVKTVLLLSKVPLDRITKIHLDYDSRTSVKLVRVLASHHWHINPQWENLGEGQASAARDIESLVAIGDKTFELRHRYPYVYDLAEAWIAFSGLPFVFSAWVSRKRLPDNILQQFSGALSYGVSHKRECLDYFKDKLPANQDCFRYLEENISFAFDDSKKEGLKLFLKHLQKI